MSDFRYLDYEGLATYTEHVKGYADGKIVYISDESEIPDPPKEGTLYVIGSEILMDEEIIIGTQTSTTSSWTGKSIDTRLHDGKRIAYYLPYPSIEGNPISLTLELSDEDNTSQQKRIYVNGSPYNQSIPGGCVIRLMYYENIFANGTRISGWISDGNIIKNNVTYTGTPVNGQVATFEGTTGTIKASGYTIAKSVPSNAKFTDTVYTHPTTAGNKHIPSGGSSGQYLKYGGSSGTAVWANPEYQFYDYGNLYKGGTSSANPKIPTSLRLSGDVKFVDGGRLIVKFKNNYNVELELGEGLSGLSSIIFPDGTSMVLTYGKMTTTGYQETHMGDHYLDIIMDDSSGTEYGYLTGYSVPVANYAGTASKVNISTSSSSTSYPLVFTNNVTAGNKTLYTDSANHLYYNPNTNTLTVPTASTTTTKASTIANKTSGSTITFDDCIKIKTNSYAQGRMNFKGSDHNNDVLYVSGGSTTSAPSIVIKTKNNKDYVGISMVGKADTASVAEIKVYGTSTSSYTTIQGGKNAVVTSDERLKDFGDNIEVDFNELKQIPKKYFTWKNDEIKSSNIGTSAQSIEKLYPELVITDDNGYKSLDYSTLSIVALAAIDKLNERIEYLENKLKEYEK